MTQVERIEQILRVSLKQYGYDKFAIYAEQSMSSKDIIVELNIKIDDE